MAYVKKRRRQTTCTGSGAGPLLPLTLLFIILATASGFRFEEANNRTRRESFQLQQLQRKLPGGQSEPANNEKPFASMLNSAVINGKVSLACDISTASSDDSVALILWYKDDSLAPIYTLDARKASSIDKAKTSVDEPYANRTNFNLKGRPAFLQLESVRQEDEGEYRCRVDFKRGRTVNTIIGLRVVELPEQLYIVQPQEPSRRLQGLIGPFDEGAELILQCVAIGGKPRPQISWRRDFNVIDETYQHVDKEGTSNELKIPSLNKNHLLSIFTCEATNNNLTSPMQTSITLDLNLRPQEVILKQLVPEALIVGQTATFECKTHGSRPQATIHWLFQNIRHDPPMNVDQQQSSSRLTLTLQRSFNQQTLTCVAENPRIASGGATSGLRQSVKLDVHYSPQLSIKLEEREESSGSPGNQLQEGNDIYLTCQMDANPRPSKPILWRFNGKPLQQLNQLASSMVAAAVVAGGQQPTDNNNAMTIMNNQSLVLRKVSRHQSGAYTCEASNQHGGNASKPLELIIRHAPVCASDDVLVFEAVVGQTLYIDCGVLAKPAKSVHFSWFLATGESNLTSWLRRDVAQDHQIDESTQRLKYKVRDTNSFGLLKCKAKNEIGLQQRPCLFQILPASLPALKHSCSLAGATQNSLQVSCEPNEHLKSEDFELNKQLAVGSRFAPSGQLIDWLGLEALRAQEPYGTAGGGPSNELSRPIQRLVFPPNWLLVELYKLAQEAGNNQQSELVAYVIVSAGHNLAHIKSLVEENRVFSEAPRSVYYVNAKQNLSTPNDSGDKNNRIGFLYAGANVTAAKVEPNLQLGNYFSFTVPSLEQEVKYKLVIYGQNLANKTRDWLVIRGETLGESADSSHYSLSRQQPANSQSDQPSANLVSLSNGEQPNLGDQPGKSSNLPQKSIVMRSDSNAASAASSNSQAEPSGVDQHHSGSEEEAEVGKGPARLTGNGVLASLLELRSVRQLGEYKELALTYAKQKPLLAVPMAVAIIVSSCLLLIWFVGLLLSFIRPRGSSAGGGNNQRPNGQHKSYKDKPGNQPGSEQPDDIGTKVGERDIKFVLGSQQTDMGSYSSGSRDQERSLANSSSSPTNCANSQAPLISGSVRNNKQQIYAISANGRVRPLELIQDEQENHQHANYLDFVNKMYQPEPANYISGLPYPLSGTTGSLDRRELHHHQPIYLTDEGTQLELQLAHAHRQQAFNSIDRKSTIYRQQQQQQQQRPLFVADLNELDQSAGLYLTADSGNGFASSSISSPACYNNGSFSSAEYSTNSELLQGHHLRRPAGKQRVAFDLSNQKQQQQQQDEHPVEEAKFLYALASQPGGNEQHQLVLSSISPAEVVREEAEHEDQGVAGAEGVSCRQLFVDVCAPTGQTHVQSRSRKTIIRPQQPRLFPANNLSNYKGSDSGGSNSGYTADSGHESPLTACETNNSYSMQQNGNGNRRRAAGGQQKPRSVASHSSVSSSSPIEQLLMQHQRDHQTHLPVATFQKNNNSNNPNMMMLVELSPGSQESSTTLLHSVESFSEPGTGLLPICQLQNNHQMATSFGSSSSPAPINGSQKPE